jgi:hypothetical protein
MGKKILTAGFPHFAIEKEERYSEKQNPFLVTIGRKKETL